LRASRFGSAKYATDAKEYAAYLRQQLPEVAGLVRAPFNESNYFDNYDISMKGREYLIAVLVELSRGNGFPPTDDSE
jgi:hypothetical protein